MEYSRTKASKGLSCFCYYAGHCDDHFHCKTPNATRAACEMSLCGSQVFSGDDLHVSFANIKEANDILTIPTMWFLNIAHLPDQCADGGRATLTRILEAGRHDFRVSIGQYPEWQCLHLRDFVGVDWLHVHSFIGAVKSEQLPDGAFGTPRKAACALASKPAAVAAADILAAAAVYQPMLTVILA